MPLSPSSVRELDDDSIALLLQAYVDQMVDYQRSLCAAPLEGLCAALYGPGRCGGDADADADAEQRLWKYACEKMGLAVLPVYPGGPSTWHVTFLAMCNEVATLEPDDRATYKRLLRGQDAYTTVTLWTPPPRSLSAWVVQLWNHAAFGGLLCVMHYLLRRVDGIVHDGNDSALRTASANGRADVVEVLLAHGANVHARNDAALRDASQFGHAAVVQALRAAGATE